MDSEVFLFADCELTVATRELRLRGTLQPLERRALDLLIYLVRQRHRAVGKDELLDSVWGRGCVTQGVIASAVMKVRKAIDDKPGELLRTLHGTGYRFAGEAVDLQTAGQPPAPRFKPANAGRAPSLALLPIDNLTGDRELDWVAIGMLRLVAGALARDGRLEQPPPPSILSTIATLPPGASPQQRAAAAMRLLGSTHVVHVVVRRHDAGYAMACTFIVGGTEPIALEGSELTSLALTLAHELATALLPDGPLPCIHFESTNAATNVALARAMQAAAEHDWPRVRGLLAPVVEAQPDHMTAALEYLRALIALDDCEAFRLGESLLERARYAASAAVEAETHLQLGQAYARRRLNDDAQRHLDSALYLAPGHESHDWVLSTTLLRACLATTQCDFPVASALLDRAESMCNRCGDVFQQLKLLSQRVVLLAETGNMPLAWTFASQAVELHRAHGIVAGLARAESTLANASATLGRWKLTEQHALAGIATARELKAPSDLAVGLAVVCGAYRQLRRPHSLARALEALDEVDTSSPPVNRLLSLVCRAQYALALDESAAAARLLEDAACEADRAGQTLENHFVLPLLGGALVHAGREAEAQEICRRMEHASTLRRDRNLHRAWLHCEAQLALARGKRDAALERLLEARRLGACDWWSSMASLDAAWLTIERGSLSAAERLLDGMAQWLEEHPAGLATRARLLRAQGRSADALQVHRRLCATMEGDGPRYWRELGAAYEADARPAGSHGTALPATPRLPTWI